MLTLGVVTDMHFGPPATFDGKLRKLSAQAPELLAQVLASLKAEGPDLLINLGDCIEDDEPEADLRRYRACLKMLTDVGPEVVHVAGNHDRVSLAPATLRGLWGLPPAGPLYYSLDRRGVHLVVLYTHERRDRDVQIDAKQLKWLASDLAANQLPVVVLMHHSAADQELAGNRWFAGSPEICLVAQREALREVLARDGRTALVVNGHLHWNHLSVVGQVPYLTLQSLVENVDDDAPGRAAAAYALVVIDGMNVSVKIRGEEPACFQFSR